MKPFDGIFTALLTPFDANNKINEKQLEKLVLHNLKMGARGFTSAAQRQRHSCSRPTSAVRSWMLSRRRLPTQR